MLYSAIKCSLIKNVFTSGALPYVATTRWLSLTASCARSGFGSKWRTSTGEARNRTKYGDLTDGPDYTYLDGRPTPLSKGQLKRREERINTNKQVIQMLKELDFAKNYKEKSEVEEDKRIKFKAKSDPGSKMS